MTEIGIVGYGAYIPGHRIRTGEIARVWGANGEETERNLGIKSKSVPYLDEDTVTISVEAARYALRRCGIDPGRIGAIYTGSESHPYAVKPTSTIVAEAIGATPHLTAADYEFACKAGTAAIQTSMGLVGTGMIEYAIAIGADTSQGAPGDALEYSASAGGAAFVIGREKIIARINRTYSFTTDTPDFWRREGQRYPSHGGRFTGKPAYFRHILTCAKNLMEMMDTSARDYQHVVLHQPNGKFPIRAAKQLGFTKEQYETGLLTPTIGNTYSGAVMLGLSAILDVSGPGDRILAVAYGSGAGCDGFDITVTDEMENYKLDAAPTTASQIQGRKFIDYATYARFRSKIERGGE